jgi:hypothetical protein
MSLHSTSLKKIISSQNAVAAFLKRMTKAAKHSFPGWEKTLTAGIEDCALGYDQRRAVIDIHPLDDYYFAGVVALEASKIRALFAPDHARELLAQLADQVDAAANRTDRVVSDLVFQLINRIEVSAAIDSQKMPYDQVAKALLQRMGIDRIEATRHLMDDFLYRHTLGEPLALGVPQWWKAFRGKYALEQSERPAPAEIRVVPARPVVAVAPARKPRRAVAF